MIDSKEYINSKTNSIVKYNVKKNNRDVVATIVFNELNNLLEYNNISDITTPIDQELLTMLNGKVNSQLYSDIPMKLQPYCQECNNNCCCCCGQGSNDYGLLDCFILDLELEDGTSWLHELDDNGIFLLEKQREAECYGKLVCDCCDYCGCNCSNIKCQCISTLQWESVGGSILWDCDLPILLESQELCDGVCCDCEWTKPIEKEEEQIPEWVENTSDLLKDCLNAFEKVYRPDLYDKDDLKCDCKCCNKGFCSLCK